MRVLQVVDVYPPARTGGATRYAVDLSETLVRMGVEAEVLCAGSWVEGASHFNGVTEDIQNGVRVQRVHLNWRKARRPFDYLYDNEALVPVFHQVFQQFQPDVVHVHSCLTLSARIIQEAKRAGIPVVLHLHDYWFLCALQNLVRKDGTVCEGPKSAWDCQACVLAGTKALRWLGRIFPESSQQSLLSLAGRIPWITRQPGLIGMLGEMARRHAYLREVLASVDVAVAPAYSLITMFAHHGFRTDHMVYSLQGFDMSWADRVKRQKSDHIRFGYIGHLQYIKGVHILVSAFSQLPEDVPALLFIYGDPLQQPHYVKPLQAQSGPRIHWKGSFERSQLPDVLSGLDVVVVPSLSFEVNPTVIKEAFAAGIPVIVSDQPGVCEIVEHGVNGLHFRLGDPESLKEQMLRMICEGGLPERLRKGIPRVKTIEESAREMVCIYSCLASSNH